MKKSNIMFGVAFGVIGLAATVHSAEFAPASVRALGMGGSSVASTHGVDASYWNPAAYGFFSDETAGNNDNNGMKDKDFGLSVDVGASAYVFGPIEENRLKLEALPDPSLLNSASLNASQIQDAAAIVSGLNSLNSSAMGANIAVNATVGSRVFNYGIGIRTSLDFNNNITVDNVNVGFPDVVKAFTGNSNSTLATVTPTYFSTSQVTLMTGSLTGAGGLTSGQANAVVQSYDAALASSGSSAVGQEQQNTAAMQTIAGASGTDLSSNSTALSSRGVAVTEVGFTYGYAINERLSVGGVLKYMQGDIIALDQKLFSNQNTNLSIDRSNIETSTALGLDLGVMYRLPSWQAGLTIRNINKPSFEHSGANTFSNTPYLYELKPQAKMGVAWIPSDTFTLEMALDLTKNEGASTDSKSQYWNVGLEWDVWKVLAIRMGAFQNTAQTDIGLVPTLGLGLNMWAVRADLSVAVSTKKAQFDGNSIPAYAAAALALAIDF